MGKIINFFKTNFGFLILITIIVFSLYGKSINYEFLDLDDQKSINENIEFISDYKNIPKLFLKDCYYENVYGYYRPVLNLSFAMEAIFFKENPKPYHFVNIILFIFAFYLMFLLLQKLKFNSVISKFIILLFLVHPIFTSNVVYISPRAEMLLIIFAALSIINLIAFLDRNKILNLIMMIVLFSFSVFTKETGLMLIPIYIAVIYCFNLKISKKQFIALFGLLLISIIAYFCLRSIAVPKISDFFKFENLYFYVDNIVVGLMLYTYKIFIPGNIAIILSKINITTTYIVFNVSVYSFLIYLLYKKILNRKIVIFSIIWFMLMLFPTFFITDYQFFFHRIFTAFLGVIIILILLIEIIVKKYSVSKKYLLILFSILFITYSFGAYKQADKYKNSETFWQNAYFDCPKYHLVLASLGKICLKYGNIKQGYKYLKAAVQDENSLNIYAKDLATVLLEIGNLQAAERMLQYSYKGFVYYDTMSKIYTEQGNFEKALICGQKAYEIKSYANNLLKLSRLYALVGKYEQAKDLLLKTENKTANNYYILAMLYEDLKDKQKAVEAIKKAIELEPNNQEYQLLLSKFLNKS